MTITKCDKCKKEFNPVDKFTGSIHVALRCYRHVPRDSWNYDFCPECMEDMQRAIAKELNNLEDDETRKKRLEVVKERLNNGN